MKVADVRAKFENVFKVNKPVIGMLHLKRGNGLTVLEIARNEIDLMLSNGVNAVLVENYFGKLEDVAEVLSYLQNETSGIVYGVNVLGKDEFGFEYADKYGASFIQIDSVCGHLEPKEDAQYFEQIRMLRKNSNAILLGGVRFKYQPYRSGRSLEADLLISTGRCDAVVVTGEGTGIGTPLEKVVEFRRILKGFPLVVGAGLTVENCRDQMLIADGAIVGSYFKEGHEDIGDVNAMNVRRFMDVVKTCR